jgi:hypothetical protein
MHLNSLESLRVRMLPKTVLLFGCEWVALVLLALYRRLAVGNSMKGQNATSACRTYDIASPLT